jgi:hypothetical protein
MEFVRTHTGPTGSDVSCKQYLCAIPSCSSSSAAELPTTNRDMVVRFGGGTR